MKKYYLLLLFTYIAQAQVINIPDANFKATLLLANASNGIARNTLGQYIVIDANGDGEIDLAEAQAVYFLNVSGAGITSLVGIENFSNLRELNCSVNNLTTLPISGLTQLRDLLCYTNQLSSLASIQNLTTLESLYLSDNPLTSIDLHNLSQLWRIWISDTTITEINLCGTAVRFLWCTDNPNLTALYLKNNIVSTDLARLSTQGPPPLHNFEFYNNVSLSYICYDEGEYPAVLHGIGYNTTGKTITTSCDSACTLATPIKEFTIDIKIYPNPTQDEINIEFDNTKIFINKISIYNSLGQKIAIFSNTTKLDVSTLSQGTYFITVETDSEKVTQRFVKF